MKLTTFKFLCLASILSADFVLAKHGALTFGSTVATPKASPEGRTFVTKRNGHTIPNNKRENAAQPHPIIPRGGACSDTNPMLFLKIGTTTLFESAALFGILWASLKIASSSSYPAWIPTVLNQSLIELLASFGVVFGSSFVGALVEGGMSAATNQALNPTQVVGEPDWYKNLKKPTWNPPGWVFPIMWLIVSKPTQLCALSRMFKFGIPSDTAASKLALVVYTTHLALGNAWNKVFFGLECVGRGTFVISLFYAALLTSTYLFYNIDKGAGYYMLPTCGWVTVATALQYSIYFKNPRKCK